MCYFAISVVDTFSIVSAIGQGGTHNSENISDVMDIAIYEIKQIKATVKRTCLSSMVS
jgi:hypothetical protein